MAKAMTTRRRAAGRGGAAVLALAVLAGLLPLRHASGACNLPPGQYPAVTSFTVADAGTTGNLDTVYVNVTNDNPGALSVYASATGTARIVVGLTGLNLSNCGWRVEFSDGTNYTLAASTNAPSALPNEENYGAATSCWLTATGAVFYVRLFCDGNRSGTKDPVPTGEQEEYLNDEGQPFEIAVTVLSYDSDGDGLPDEWEQQIIDDDPEDDIEDVWDVLPEDDFDGDGVSNGLEYLRGTDATDPHSVNATIYVDALNGDDANDGITAPKATIGAGVDVAIHGDTVQVEAEVYEELAATYDLTGKSLTIICMGEVVVR